MAVLRDEPERGRDLPGREASELLGRVGDELAVGAQHVTRVGRLEEQRAAVDVRDRMEPELERRDDAEVPAAAAERPEQVLVLALARHERAPVRRDHLGGEQVVAREAEATREVADTAAESEPADAGRRDDAAGGREAVGVGRVVEDAPRGAALRASGAPLGIDVDSLHPGQVDHDASVDRAEAGDAVTPAADGQVELVLAGEVHRGRDIRVLEAPHDDFGPPVDHRVEDLARVLVAPVARRHHPPPQAAAKPLDRLHSHVPRPPHSL